MNINTHQHLLKKLTTTHQTHSKQNTENLEFVNAEMMMEEKLVINELEVGKELANQLMSNLKHTSSSDSNKILISEILRIYQNTILILSFNEDKNKRSHHEIDGKDSKNFSKKRKISEKKTENVKVVVATGEENGSIDDGHCWRKYGQKDIHGSSNPRAYYRCTHRFTQNCLAVKQVQKSDKDSSMFEVKYLGNHTCNNNNNNNSNFTVSMFQEDVTDTKPTKSEQVMISLEDLENKKNIFRTFSFSNHEIENGEWKSNIFSENLVNNLSPTTSGSGITNDVFSVPVTVENSETADSYFSSLDNIIDFGQDWLWS